MMADRAVHDVARSESAVRPVLDHVLAMRERDSSPKAGKPEAMQPLGRGATETIAAAPMAEAAPPPEAKNVPLAPGGAGDASRLAGEGGSSRQVASAGALAAASPGKDASDLAASEVALGTAMLASAAKRQPVAAPVAGVPLNAVVRAGPVRSGGAHSVAGRLQGVSEPAVVRLEVGVRDAGRQVALTNEVIRSRVVARGGRFAFQADPSVILVADPTGWGPGLFQEIEQAPGVVYMRSDMLLGSDPVARQASWLAAEQQWHQVARDFVAWAASGQGPGATRFRLSPDPHVAFSDVPPAIPRDYVPLVIVLRAVRPAASEPASQ